MLIHSTGPVEVKSNVGNAPDVSIDVTVNVSVPTG